jgi:hypothetical protein
VYFNSCVDWQQRRDLVRCSPNFHGFPRYDCVIIKTTDGFIFGRLIFLFQFTVGGIAYPFAFIHPYDASIGPHQQKDIDLGFYRVRAKPRQSAEFISTDSIVRGALLVEDFGRVNDHLIVDLVDTDMFLRLISMYSK